MLRARSDQSLTKISEPPLVYKSVYELPLYNFIQISLTGDTEKWGVMPDIWNTITEQYAELSGDKSMGRAFVLTRQITYLKNRLNIIQLVVNQLSVTRNEELIKILQNDLGFRLKFDDLQGDLVRVVSLAKPDFVKLKQAEAQYNDLKKDEKAATEADWDDELTHLGKFQAFKIDKKQTTVSEYLSIKKAFKAHVDYMNRNGK